MEPLSGILSKVGLDLETCLTAAGAVYLLIEWFKVKFPITHGVGTQVAAFVLASGVAMLLMFPNWPGIIALAFIAWLIPDAFHQARYSRNKQS